MTAPNAPPDSSAETAAKPLESRTEAAIRFTPGTLLAGRYRIVSPLGQGGMGEVYRADDIRLGQPVALKFLSVSLAADSGRLNRLVDEVRIGRQISHPNVCRLYDIAEAEGHHFLVMEYVDGEDLASLLRRIGRLPGDKAIEIARGLCAGLAAAHDKEIIHRDLKPANVMIDGKGHARIADFGLAALSQDGNTDMSGTPQYMAPEQLMGQGASLRSDVYALGLVLHEMLTGKRVFEAKSVHELRALHADSRPLGPSSSASDIDPALDRLVTKCLSRDPNDRPASARDVLLALPGGDPLQAAILAGETPSPEMVAAAGKVGDIRASTAWACLILGLIALFSIAALAEHAALFRRVPFSNSPEVLAARGRAVLARLGYTGPVVDTAHGFQVDSAFLNYVAERDRTATRWDRVGQARPGALGFFYRESPQRLVANSWFAQRPWLGPPELARITRDEPPMTLPGMATVHLDMEGRLIGLAVVPPPFEELREPVKEPDWPALLTEAGLVPKLLAPSSSGWAAPVDSDRKIAWDGSYPEQPDIRMHVEAASYHGRPVFFKVTGPWTPRPGAIAVAPPDPPALSFAIAVMFLSLVPVVAACIVLVRRNIRTGRGDRRGSFRLALLTFGALCLAQAARADHTSLGTAEYALIIHILSQGCYGGIAVWSFYMAIEPAVRRRWPQILVSWNRLLTGRFRDPLVARDVMAGTLLGLGVALKDRLLFEVPALRGGPPLMGGLGGFGVLSVLDSPRHVVYYFLLGICLGVVYSLALLFVLYLLHALVRRDWAAGALLFLWACIPGLGGLSAASDLWIEVPRAVTFAALIVLALTRFGLLTSAVQMFAIVAITRTPFTLDPSDWYAGRSFAIIGFFAALLAVSAYTSLGGKPIFGKALLDD
jgi:hypothetical protein